MAENDIAAEDELILRRVQLADGRTRAFVNDQPVSVQVLKALGAALVEIHGQHDERALVDAATHRALLDAFGGLEGEAAEVARLWDERRAREAAVAAHRAPRSSARSARPIGCATRSRNCTTARARDRRGDRARRTARRHDAGGEGRRRSARRARGGRGRRSSPVPALSAAVRRLERRARAGAGADRAGGEGARCGAHRAREARGHLEAALAAADHDPRELERIEERLFALRAAGRKYNVPVDELAALAARHAADLGLIDAGAEQLPRSRRPRARPASAIAKAAADAVRRRARRRREKLDKAVNAELKPLKLERARFSTEIVTEPEAAGPHGIDRIEFWVQTNPGTRPGPLMKVASGGELARFLLALKVVLADRGSAPTLVFDEIDTGVGGAVADAIGVRLARLAAQRAGRRGDACAAGRGARRPALSHQQGARSTRASASRPASPRLRPSGAARRSRACWPAPRSPPRRARPPSG